MKILQIIPNLAIGGAERFVVDLANEMSKENDVYVCTLFDMIKNQNDFFLSELSPNIKFISLGKKLGLDFSIFWKIKNLIDEVKPDIINTHLASINYVMFNNLSSFLRNKKIKYFHTIHTDAKMEVKHKLEFLTRKFLYKFKLVTPITISEESSNSFKRFYNLENDCLIYNGRKFEVQTEEFNQVSNSMESYRKSSSTKILVNVGRFIALKNQYFLAKIVDELARNGKDIVLLIIGDYSHPEGESIKKAICELQSDRIFLLGMKKNVIDYLTLSDAFCISSIYEGMPISLIEAMSVGCVPICTPVGGIKNVIDTSLGYLSEDLTPESYRNAIEDFLKSTENDKIKDNLINAFNLNFNIASTSNFYLKIYNN